MVSEFGKYNHPTQCVLIYRPEAIRDFDAWLDRQLVTHLLRNEASNPACNHALQQIAFDAVARAFPDKSHRVNEAENVLTHAAEQHFAGRIVKVLLEPFSNRRKMKSLAEELAMKLGIAGEVGANEFCVTLMLLASGPMATDAVQVFTARRTPQSLHLYLSDDLVSRWNLARLISATLRYLGGALVLFFDQLESLAVSDDAQPHALQGLLSSCIALTQRESNVACIIAALQEVANDAVPRLPGPDQQRIRLPPRPQDVELIRRANLVAFLGPRLAYLEQQGGAHMVAPLRGFADWVQREAELNQLPPRFVLALMNSYGRLVGYAGRPSGSVQTFKEAWENTVEQFDSGSHQSCAGGAAADSSLEEAWTRLQAEYDPADFVVGSAMDAMRLLDWSLEHVAPAALGLSSAKLLVPEVRRGIATADLKIEGKNKRETRALFILDQRNYRGELLNALKQVADERETLVKVVLRFRDKFPATGSSQLLPPLNAIKSRGGIVGDLLEPELLLLSQLQQMHANADEGQFAAWLRGKVLALPGLKACVRQR